MADIKQIVRIINADIEGGRQLHHAITKVYGVNFALSDAICNALNLDKTKKVGSCTPEEIKKIEGMIKDPIKSGLPSYMCNRRKDFETGEDKHIITSDLKLTNEFDVKRFKRVKSYRGIRHALGLTVRGQKTRSNFRKGKAIGVAKKKKGRKG